MEDVTMFDLLGQAQPSGPEAWTAIGIVGTVIAWMMWRFNRADADERTDRVNLEAKIARLEAERDTARADAALQHKLKHAQANAAAGCKGTLDLVRRYAKKCQCGALDPIRVLLESKE